MLLGTMRPGRYLKKQEVIMKKLLLAVLFVFVGCSVHAEDLTLGGIPRLISEKLTEVKPAGLINFSAEVGAGAYLPVWTFHNADNTVNYVEALNIGYKSQQGSHPDGFFMPVALNLPAISARIWSFAWAQQHLTRTPFPNFFFGPAVVVGLNVESVSSLRWDGYKQWLNFVGSVRF